MQCRVQRWNLFMQIISLQEIWKILPKVKLWHLHQPNFGQEFDSCGKNEKHIVYNTKYRKWIVDAYYILCYYDFEICICACKTGKKIWFRRSPKEKYEEHGSCLLWEIRSFRMKRSKWPFFYWQKKQIRINILKGGKIKNPKERRSEELVKEGKW